MKYWKKISCFKTRLKQRVSDKRRCNYRTQKSAMLKAEKTLGMRLEPRHHFWLSLEEEVSWSSRSAVVIKDGQASTVYERKSQIPTIFSKQEPQSPLISWADPFPSRFINRTIVMKLLLPAVIYLFSLALFLYHCAKPPLGTVSYINLLGNGWLQGLV